MHRLNAIYLKEKLFFLWRIMERVRKQWVTIHRRSMYAKDYFLTSDPDPLTDPKKMAIILQGPLARASNFTLETVKLYKKIFPQTFIIVSTWDDENAKDITLLRNEGADVLLNKKPSYPGPYNVNLQIISTRQGMKRANEIGVDYIIKSRTDHRIYAPNSKRFLINLIKTFPLTHNYTLQKQRLATLCYGGTFKYRLYNISDIFMFGGREDMLLYWDVPLVTQPPIEPVAGGWGSYLFTEYLKRIGRTLRNTLEDSWDTYTDHIVTVDHPSLDIYWYKPRRNQEYTRREYHTNENRLVYFSEWLNMYCKKNRTEDGLP